VVHAGEPDESGGGNGDEIWSHYFSIPPKIADGIQVIGTVFNGVAWTITAAANGILKMLKLIVQGYVEINNVLPFTKKIDDFTALDTAIDSTANSLEKYKKALIDASTAETYSSQLNKLYN